jgi:hypothetical protein
VKHCRDCKELKPLAQYSKKKDTKDRLQPVCKSCAAEFRRKWVATKPGYVKAYNTKYMAEQKDAIARQRKARYVETQPDQVRKAKEYRERNKEATLANKRRYYAENKEKCLDVVRKWRAEFGKEWERNRCPIERAMRTSRRRAALLRAVPSWADEKLIAEFYETARGLGMWTGDWYHVDHIVPLLGRTVCGLHCQANLQVLPAVENIRKLNRHWPDQP